MHQLCQVDPCSPGGHGRTPNKAPRCSQEMQGRQLHLTEDGVLYTIDQAHEQNNACIKGDGGVVGLTDNPSALLRWMVAGPEVAKATEEFQDGDKHWGRRVDTRHQDQTPCVPTSFSKDVRSLVRVMENLGNPFKEESVDLVVLDTKEMACPAAVESVRNVKRIDQEQFQAFTREWLVERTKPIYDAIRRKQTEGVQYVHSCCQNSQTHC